MLTINLSVGYGGKNRKFDVLNIQKAFNTLKLPLTKKSLEEDGLFGKITGDAIKIFQKKYAMLMIPDGRIDPGGRTINKLAKMMRERLSPGRVLFTLDTRPLDSYKTGMRAFGSERSRGKRKHAGVDLYAEKGTPIRVIKDGIVVQNYAFYLGTHALEVNHGDMVIRYGEISHVAPGIATGVTIIRGQVIAYVGELNFRDGKKMSMLHLEAYKGTTIGSLTVRSSKPYQRRQDLFDPTSMLDAAAMK